MNNTNTRLRNRLVYLILKKGISSEHKPHKALIKGKIKRKRAVHRTKSNQ